MEQIKSLKDLTHDELFGAFQNAFEDYEMQLDKNQLADMLKRRGFNPELSFGAFDGDKLVSFTFNGIGNYNGIPTAYDTGTGTTKDYRGKGLAQKIFNHSISFLKDAGIQQYILEVLQHNHGAVHLYKKMGFEVIREFEYYVFAKSKVVNGNMVLSGDYAIEDKVSFEGLDMNNFWDFHPSWQNSFESVSRQLEAFRSVGIFENEELIAYAVFEPENGDITQFAVHKNYRSKGLGTILFKEMMSRMDKEDFKIINTDLTCKPVHQFIESLGIELTGKQFEMRREL